MIAKRKRLRILYQADLVKGTRIDRNDPAGPEGGRVPRAFVCESGSATTKPQSAQTSPTAAGPADFQSISVPVFKGLSRAFEGQHHGIIWSCDNDSGLHGDLRIRHAKQASKARLQFPHSRQT